MAPVSTRDKFPTADMFGETVKVKVGIKPDPVQTFVLHQDVLTFYSGYFEAALKSHAFKEGQDKVIELPEENVSLFRQFVRWLYIRHFDEPRTNDFLPFCKMWAFADRRQIPLLMNNMIDRWVAKSTKENCLNIVDLNFVYENSSENAGLRRLMIMHLSKRASTEYSTPAFRVYWPEDAMWDMMRALLQLKKDGITKYPTAQEMTAIDTCDYHSHEEGVRCVKGASAK